MARAEHFVNESAPNCRQTTRAELPIAVRTSSFGRFGRLSDGGTADSAPGSGAVAGGGTRHRDEFGQHAETGRGKRRGAGGDLPGTGAAVAARAGVERR